MAYWWVNHNQTHNQEIEGGYIWSPKTNSNGAKNQTYTNLSLVTVGDVVYSFASSQIKAIGVVSRPHISHKKPVEFGAKGANWGDSGWLVYIDWQLLSKSFKPKEYIDDLSRFLPGKNSPIQKNGNGNQGCYLAAISKELDGALRGIMVDLGNRVEELNGDDLRERDNNKEEKNIIDSSLQETEKNQLVKARIGQGVFRSRLEKIEPKCRVTKLDDKRFLVASHIKPWCKSTNIEKLDGSNGLLLSPHIDKLFDRGWITFSSEGKVLYSSEEVTRVMKSWSIDPDMNVGKFTSKQKEYLSYHQKNIFRGGDLTHP